MSLPLVSIICPVFNSERYLRETIESVVEQNYGNIEFIIIDGNSTDGTGILVDEYMDRIAHYVSEPDRGMYDALAKGFELSAGEIICYINAGDFLNPFAISAVVEIFESTEAQWITGYRSICNERSIVTHVDLPFRYKRSLLKTGSYGTRLPYVQQETTFWRRGLLTGLDLEYFRNLRFAGDYYLWWTFAGTASLDVVSCPFGVFKKHAGQLSENIEKYANEVRSFSRKRSPLHFLEELFELLLWGLHPRIRAFFWNGVYRFDHRKQQWLQDYR